MATGALVENPKKLSATAEQQEAWRYYGWPAQVTGVDGVARDAPNKKVVGEVRYVVGWMADQLSRINWQVLINGSDKWSVKVGEGTDQKTITSDPSIPEDAEGHGSVKEASRELLNEVGWTRSVVRQATTNLFVAGEFDYVFSKSEKKWSIVSVVNRRRDALLKSAGFKEKGLWPHPADDESADAPLFGVLPILDDLDWLSRQSRWQSSSRVGMRGILAAADGLEFANGSDFWQQFKKSLGTPMKDPTDQSPIILRGATELIQNGIQWTIPTFPYNDKIDSQIEKTIQRLAYGLPIPPEILLGMQAQSRATAFQVEGSAYRAHIEPPAQLLAPIPTAALKFILEDDLDVEIVLDPSDLLARRYSVQDTTDAFDRGAVSYRFYRETLGIPESAAATEEDIELLKSVTRKADAATQDPANSAGSVTADPETGDPTNRSVAASVGAADAPSLPVSELESLASELVQIDFAVREWLSGATGQAVERAREKIGANARSRASLKSQIPRDIENGEVASTIGRQALDDAGVDYEAVLVSALEPLSRQWRDRVTAAQRQTAALLGKEADPGFTEDDVSSSVNLLVELTGEHIMSTLTSPIAQPLGLFGIQRVLAASGGSPTGIPGDTAHG